MMEIIGLIGFILFVFLCLKLNSSFDSANIKIIIIFVFYNSCVCSDCNQKVCNLFGLPRCWNGIQVRLRCVCRKTWEFESPSGYKKTEDVSSVFF